MQDSVLNMNVDYDYRTLNNRLISGQVFTIRIFNVPSKTYSWETRSEPAYIGGYKTWSGSTLLQSGSSSDTFPNVFFDSTASCVVTLTLDPTLYLLYQAFSFVFRSEDQEVAVVYRITEVTPHGPSFVLENGSHLLLENGDYLILS